MKPSTLIPLLLLITITTTAAQEPVGAAEDHTTSMEGVVIDQHVTCDDESMYVSDNITIVKGGILELDGCTLLVDSPPYADAFYSQSDEGLAIIVNEGGRLIMNSTQERPAGIQRMDPQYGYTVKVEGAISATGTPAHPVRITGLEGAYQGRLIFGGLQIRGGTADMHGVAFLNNTGPSIFGFAGAQMRLEDVSVEGNGGIAASSAESLSIRGLTGNVPLSMLSLSNTDDVIIDDCDIESYADTIYMSFTTASISRCTIAANLTAVTIVGSSVEVTESRFDYGLRAVNAGSKPKDLDRHEMTLHIADTAFMPRPEAQLGIGSVAHRLDLSNVTFFGTGGPQAVNASSMDSLRIVDSQFASVHEPAVHIVDVSTSLEMHGNDYARAEAPVLVQRTTAVQILGAPIDESDKITVRINDAVRSPDQSGLAVVRWTLWQGGDPPAEFAPPARLIVTSMDGTRIVDQAIAADAVSAQVTWPQEVPMEWGRLALYLASGALAAVVWIVAPKLMKRKESR